MDERSRRQILQLLGAGSTGLITGCSLLTDTNENLTTAADSPTPTPTAQPTATSTATAKTTKKATDTVTPTDSPTPTSTPTATAEPSPLAMGEDKTHFDIAVSLIPQQEGWNEGPFRAADARLQRQASTDCAVNLQGKQFGPEDQGIFAYTNLMAGSYDGDTITWIFDPENVSRDELFSTFVNDRGHEHVETRYGADVLQGKDQLSYAWVENDKQAAIGLYDSFLVYSSTEITSGDTLEKVTDSLNARANNNSVADPEGAYHKMFQDEKCFINKENTLGIQIGIPNSYAWAMPDNEFDSEWYEGSSGLTTVEGREMVNRPVTTTFDNNLENLSIWYPKMTVNDGITEQNKVEHMNYQEDNLEESSPWYNARKPWKESWCESEGNSTSTPS